MGYRNLYIPKIGLGYIEKGGAPSSEPKANVSS